MRLDAWRKNRTGSGKMGGAAKNVGKTPRFRAIFGCLLLLGMGIYVFEMAVNGIVSHPARDIQSKGFIVDTPGCRIPNMEMFDAHIRQMVWKMKPLDCETGSLPQLVSSNLTALFVVKASLRYHGVWHDADLRCCFRPYWRVEGGDETPKEMLDNAVAYAEKCHAFVDEARIRDEFVKVECRYADKLMYVDFFAFTPLKDAVEQRCARPIPNVRVVRNVGDPRDVHKTKIHTVDDIDSHSRKARKDIHEAKTKIHTVDDIDSHSRKARNIKHITDDLRTDNKDRNSQDINYRTDPQDVKMFYARKSQKLDDGNDIGHSRKSRNADHARNQDDFTTDYEVKNSDDVNYGRDPQDAYGAKDADKVNDVRKSGNALGASKTQKVDDTEKVDADKVDVENVDGEGSEEVENVDGKRNVSVLIVGVDSVSRLNFHRQMTSTATLLADLGAIEMLGYNKVSDNTFPNVVAMLTGISWLELKAKCWPTYGHTFDKCHFLWSNFSDAGFRTAFAEDDTISGIFNYIKLGFAHQPTDYYMRTYHHAYEAASKSILNLLSKPNDIGRLGKRCIGPRSNAEVLLEYLTKFAKTMARKRYFGLFWESTLTHDYLNDAQQLDSSLQKTLQRLAVSGSLDETVMIIMSDHGLRFGEIRSTFQGWLEDRLPLLTFTFPDWFLAKYPQAIANLCQNIRQLTTPFDLHYTLTDFLDLTQLTDAAITRRTKLLTASVHKSRGQSLFLPVSESRTCVDAGIDDHYCTCQRTADVSVDDVNVKEAAAYLVGRLNAMLGEFPVCARLEVSRVVSARRQFPIDDLDSLTTEKVVDFVVVVETMPGAALFEGTVRQLKDGFQFASEEMEVSRVNTYANQSWCVTDFKMKMYCYCEEEMKGDR